MNFEKERIKYAHTDGYTNLSYSSDGNTIISCGMDGDVRLWKGFQDNDPNTSCVGAEFVRCVVPFKEHLYASSDDSRIQILDSSSGERVGIFTNVQTTVNHIIVSNDEKFLAWGSDDKICQFINMESKEKKEFEDLNGVVLSLALSPQNDLIAISGGDGSLKIFSTLDQSLLKSFSISSKCNVFANAKNYGRSSFHPTSNKLAYPNKNCITILDTSDWSTICSLLPPPEHSAKECNIVAYSPCGKYIAGSFGEDIILWDAVKRNVRAGTSTSGLGDGFCSALSWNPKGNGELAYADSFGRLGMLSCVFDEGSSLSEFRSIEEEIDAENEDVTDSEMGNNFNNDDDEEDNENTISINKLKRTFASESHIENDVENISRRSNTPVPRIPEIPLQDTFMPTASPYDLERRYLCWNDIGIVRSYDSNDDGEARKYIEVEFHDSSFHSNIIIPNAQDYVMGSLSGSVLALANEKIFSVMPLTTGVKEWRVSLDVNNHADLSVVCIAASEKLVCIAMSNLFVHVYSTYGIQKSVFAVPGPAVSMGAHDNFLLVAYHSAAVRGSDQVMSVLCCKLDGISIECRDLKASLTVGSTLSWLGFSDKGSPLIFDSMGLLFIHPLTANVWIPICDTKLQLSSPTDTLFLTSVHESTGSLRGIKCRFGLYPVFVPRPIIMEMPIQMQFLESDTERGTLEANLSTWYNLQVNDTEKKIKETALKAFALSCKSDMEKRAFELIEILQNNQLVMLASKYATKLDKVRLATKLSELADVFSDSNENHKTVARASVNGNTLRPLHMAKKPTMRTPIRNILNEDVNVSNNYIAPAEKRKLPDTPDVTQDGSKEKQRKLDRFIFSKR